MSSDIMCWTAIIDVYSRYIVGWGLHNTLQAKNVREVLLQSIGRYGTPRIVNSDQRSQFSSLVDGKVECARGTHQHEW